MVSMASLVAFSASRRAQSVRDLTSSGAKLGLTAFSQSAQSDSALWQAEPGVLA